MAPSLFPPSPGPLSHTSTQCTAPCIERGTIKCAMRRAFRRTADRSHAGMHNRALGHASFMLTCTRSLRCWRKCQKHHAVVDHACDKRGSVMHQSAARSGVGLMGFVRSVIVHNKTQSHVERPCSHIAAVSTQQAAPVANESSCVKSSQSKIHLRCPTADAAAPAGPCAETWAVSSRECSSLAAQTAEFQVRKSYFTRFPLLPV